MSDTLLGTLFRMLDFVVIERLDDRSMRMLTPPPWWFVEVAAVAADGAPVTLGGALPFLDHVLQDAEAFWWTKREGVHTAEPFAVRGASDDYLLRARAVTVGPQALIVLERLTGQADVRPVLQAAREARLAHERLVKEVDTVRVPAADLVRLVDRLLEADLAPAPVELAKSIVRASEKLRVAADALAAPR